MRDDLKLLQGTWSVTALAVEGQKMPESMIANAAITVEGNRFTSTGMGAVYKGTLKLDPSSDPPQLDMKFDAGPEKGNTNIGIYSLEGNIWKLCIATRGKIRPARFASTRGSAFAFEILTRGKSKPTAKRKTEAPKKVTHRMPATEFEGEWKMVSGVMNGVAMDDSAVQWMRRVTAGDETTVLAGPQVMLKVKFTSDASRSPKTMDYVITDGPNKGKTQLGIYELSGDLLRVCVAAPGSPRAAKLESVRGDGATFTVWKR